jgi:hypothetical protein
MILPSVRHGENKIIDLIFCSTVCEMRKPINQGITPFKAKSFGSGPFVLDKVRENLIS